MERTVEREGVGFPALAAGLCGVVSAVVTGMAGGRNPSWILRAMFVVWVAAPFVALVWLVMRRGMGMGAVLVALLWAAVYVAAELHPLRQMAAPFTVAPVLMWLAVAAFWLRR